MDLTLGAALLAGLLSFLSPCVLPVVPAYLGQLGIIAVRDPLARRSSPLVPAGAAASGSAGSAPLPLGLGQPIGVGLAMGDERPGDATPSPSGTRSPGWRAMPNAFAFVLGFTVVFTLLGVTVYVVAGPLRANLPLLRPIGGVVLIVLGLNLMGVLRLRHAVRARGSRSSASAARTPGRPSGRASIGGFALGAIFAVGWTPCIGPTLGAILTMAARRHQPAGRGPARGLLDRPGHPLPAHGPGGRPGTAHHAPAAALQPPDRDRGRRASSSSSAWPSSSTGWALFARSFSFLWPSV